MQKLCEDSFPPLYIFLRYRREKIASSAPLSVRQKFSSALTTAGWSSGETSAVWSSRTRHWAGPGRHSGCQRSRGRRPL